MLWIMAVLHLGPAPGVLDVCRRSCLGSFFHLLARLGKDGTDGWSGTALRSGKEPKPWVIFARLCCTLQAQSRLAYHGKVQESGLELEPSKVGGPPREQKSYAKKPTRSKKQNLHVAAIWGFRKSRAPI